MSHSVIHMHGRPRFAKLSFVTGRRRRLQACIRTSLFGTSRAVPDGIRWSGSHHLRVLQSAHVYNQSFPATVLPVLPSRHEHLSNRRFESNSSCVRQCLAELITRLRSNRVINSELVAVSQERPYDPPVFIRERDGGDVRTSTQKQTV